MRQDLYEDLYSKEHEHWWHVGKRSIVYGLLNRSLPREGGKAARNGRMALDLGCGTGQNLEHLQRYATATGTDYFEEALKFCRERGHTMLARADAVDLPFADSTFEIMTALDVIEHLDDDYLALKEMLRVMKPGGILIVSVPSYKFLWTYWDDILGHRRRYTTAMLRDVAERAGFRVRKLSYSNALTLVPAMAVRVLKNARYRIANKNGSQPDPKSDFIMLPRALNRALISYYGLESRVLRRGRLPFGLSVVAVLQRPGERQRI